MEIIKWEQIKNEPFQWELKFIFVGRCQRPYSPKWPFEPLKQPMNTWYVRNKRKVGTTLMKWINVVTSIHVILFHCIFFHFFNIFLKRIIFSFRFFFQFVPKKIINRFFHCCDNYVRFNIHPHLSAMCQILHFRIWMVFFFKWKCLKKNCISISVLNA